jgi:hypothetical protein
MTLPDPGLEREGSNDLSKRDLLPPNERGQDELRTEISHGLAVDGSRPLTKEEREAAEHDSGIAERVYAPASERVPKDPLPGHREFIEHEDDHTPERVAAANPPEPSFTRVERPSTVSQHEWTPSPTSTPYSSPDSNPTFNAMSDTARSGFGFLPMGIGTLLFMACGGIGAWLYMRWQRERNKPINRLRRQALMTAAELRDRMPTSRDELAQPGGVGLAATLASVCLVVLRQALMRKPSSRVQHVTDADWQQRLITLKERWTPRRLEMEKFSISRHH